MGWSYNCSPSDKASFVASRLEVSDNEKARYSVIRHSLKGNCLWMVREILHKSSGKVERYIHLDLIACDKGCWGYKDMCESMGPCFYNCPLSYLDMVPEADPVWRKRVRAFHANAKIKFAVGDVVKLVNCKIPEVKLVGVHPLRGESGGVIYRVPRRLIAIGVRPEDILYPDVQERRDMMAAGKSVRCSALGLDNGRVHVLFAKADESYEGFFMSESVYHAIPFGVNACPDDYRKHGELSPASPDFGGGVVSKEIVVA